MIVNVLAFYPRDALLALVFDSNVRPSVPLSVTRRYCVMISSLSGRHTILVFWCQISSQNSKGFPRAGASKKGGVDKISDDLELL